MDFTQILSGLTVDHVIVAILLAGVLYATLDFVTWTTRQVAGFFNGGNERRAMARYRLARMRGRE